MIVDGNILKKYREEKKYSREELAEKIGISAKTVQRIENGNSTKKSTVQLIKEKLGISIEVEEKFTKSQIQAINSNSKYKKIIAGAGAGKTRVLEEIIAEKLKGGLLPSELIVCTFTDKAATELKMRVKNRLKFKGIDKGSADILLGTIHGICMRILQEYSDKYNDYNIIDPMKNMHFINRYFNKIGVGNIHKIKDTDDFMKKYYDTNRFINICNIILENPINNELIPYEVKSAVNKYKELLKEKHYFNFATIQYQFLEELKSNEEFRNRIKKNIKYLIVDEYQDVNYLQNEIFKELINLGVGASIVGDADQAIYQFRGSDYTYIQKFDSEQEKVETIKLEENFRSTEGIIAIAEESIRRNEIREDKQMISRKGTYEIGDIICSEFETIEEEYIFIADRIEELIDMGIPTHEIAVLFRKKKYMQKLVDILTERNIIVDVENMSSLFLTREIKAVKGIFEYLQGEINEDELELLWEFSQVYIKLEKLKLGIDNLSLKKPEIWNKNNSGKLNQEYLLQEIYQEFLGDIGLINMNNEEEYERILFNLGKFSQLINDFEVINYDFSAKIKIATFNSFLNNTKEEYPEGELDNIYKKANGVKIMTIHKSKGLQFSAVFIPNMVKNIFPSSRLGGRSEWHFIPEEAILNANILRATGLRLLEDERRVFYVAVTRSRKFLFLTKAKYSSLAKETSQFLSEAMGAEGYIFEYDKEICKYSAREKWKAFKEEERIFTIDFTNLSDFFNCGFGFKLSQIYGFINPINLRMGYGKSIHNMAKEVNKFVLENPGEKISDEKIGEILDSFYLPYVGEASVVRQTMFNKAIACIENYIVENARKFKEVEYVEKYIEVPIRNDILICGRIDLIRKKDIAGKVNVIIIDYKTSERNPSEIEQKLQLEIYALGYQHLTGKNADIMQIVDIEGNKNFPPRAVIQKNLYKTAREIEEACDSIINNKSIRKTCSKKSCKNCNQRRLCDKIDINKLKDEK